MSSCAHPARSLRAIAALILVALLAACSSGGGNGTTAGGGTGGNGDADSSIPAPPPSGRYLFYQAGTDGPLMAVDPINPTNPFTVAAAPISSKALVAIGHGTYVVTTNSVSDLHTRTIIYAQSGKLWKVSAFKSGNLTITQLSSETEAINICKTTTATDFNDHNNAAYLYELAGPDNDCNQSADNLWRMVRIGMNSSSPPISAKQPITSIDSSTTGAHNGWLVDDNKTLKFYSADFSSSQDVNGAPNYTSIKYYAPINIAQEVLRLDGVIGTYTVDSNTWTPRTNVITTNYPDSHFIRDNGYLYFADYVDPYVASPIMRIYRDKLIDDSDTETLLDLPAGFNAIDDELTLKKTNNKLIVAIHDVNASSDQTLVVAIDLTNGAKTYLTGNIVTGNIRSLITSSDRLYYSFDLSTAYLSDGTTEGFTEDPTPQPNLSGRDSFTSSTSAWIGAVQPNQYRIGNTLQPQTVFLATNFNTATGFAGGSITRYDAATATKGELLGNIPPNIKEVQIEGNRAITLANGLRSDGGNDIFFVDIDTTSSLVPVTEDAIDDIIIDAYH